MVPGSELGKVEDMIRRINSAAPIHPTSHAQIDLSKVMNLNAYSDGIREILTTSENYICSDQDHNHSHGHSHSHSLSFDGISNIIVHLPGPLKEKQIEDLDNWIRSVLWDRVVPEHTSDTIVSYHFYFILKSCSFQCHLHVN